MASHEHRIHTATSVTSSTGRQGTPVPVFHVRDVQRRVMRVAEENRDLRDELNMGRKLLGEYHAQLSIDALRQRQQKEEIQNEIQQLEAQSQHLRQRTSFLFNDSMRIELDNAKIREGFAKKDQMIRDVERLLHIEEEKYREAATEIQSLQRHVVDQSKQLVRYKNELREGKRHKLLEKQREWDAADEVDRLEGVMFRLEEELDALQRRIKGAEIGAVMKQKLLPPIVASTLSDDGTRKGSSATSALGLIPVSRQQRKKLVSTPLGDDIPTSKASRTTPSEGSAPVSRGTSTRSRTDGITESRQSSRGSGEDEVQHGGSVSKLVAGNGGPKCKRKDCAALRVRLQELEEILEKKRHMTGKLQPAE